jgi:hypothetical protein
MEHLLHLFGGGCGEHMLLPGLAALGMSLGMARSYIRCQCDKLVRRIRGS